MLVKNAYIYGYMVKINMRRDSLHDIYDDDYFNGINELEKVVFLSWHHQSFFYRL